MPIAQAKIGIIYPPPEVRTIVDKTAAFVARNGPEFQEKIRLNEINNPKFNFLNESDPYHAYYKHKVKEIEDNNGVDPAQTQPQVSLVPHQVIQQQATLANEVQKQQTKIIEQIFIPKEPPAEFEYIIDNTPLVQALDIDIIKLTAQFVARNGRPFLTSLMNKEQHNPTFDFVKPQHSHFSYFQHLVEQYTKILMPSKDLADKLKREIENPFNVIKDVMYRVEWTKYEQKEREKEEKLNEKERAAYSQIDWHDFVIVETVDYQQNEIGNFPPPTNPQEVGAHVVMRERMTQLAITQPMDIMQRIIEEETRPVDYPKAPIGPIIPEKLPQTDINTISIDMDQDSGDEEEKVGKVSGDVQPQVDREKIQEKLSQLGTNKGPAPQLPMPKFDLPTAPNPEKVIIRKDYNPKAKLQAQSNTHTDEEYFISPLTGERIPASKINEHMRISTLDRKWIEQKEKEIKEREEQEEVLAPGVSIEHQLKQMAEYRRDIFGRGADETIIGQRVGDESERQKDERAIWDGHSSSMENTKKRALTGVTIEEQIKAIHQSQGLLEDESSRIGPNVITRSIVTTQATISAPAQPPSVYILAKPQPPIVPVQPLMSARPLLPPSHMQPPQVINLPPPMSIIQPPPQVQQQQNEPEEPAIKKLKTEDQLIPAEDFLKRYIPLTGGLVSFNLQVPHVLDKPEWNLHGQIIPFTMKLTDLVSDIKNKLCEILGMPIAKQKLLFEGMFIKDQNSLAYYNISSDSIIHLQLKERGGRKK